MVDRVALTNESAGVIVDEPTGALDVRETAAVTRREISQIDGNELVGLISGAVAGDGDA